MIKTLFEDPYLLVLDKPPGLLVTDIPGLLARLDSSLARLAHRLDKDTSGVLLLAKNQQVLDNLQAQFKARVIKKEYLALVHGHVMGPGKIEGGVGRNPRKRDKFSVLSAGKQATTEFQPILNFKILNFKSIFNDFNERQIKKLFTMHYELFTLLRCFPRTGRTHQIRVHLKYRGFPIVSDDKYAGRKILRLDLRWCPRMFLHAEKLGFKHPVTGKWIEVTSDLPEDLKKALNKLNG